MFYICVNERKTKMPSKPKVGLEQEAVYLPPLSERLPDGSVVCQRLEALRGVTGRNPSLLT